MSDYHSRSVLSLCTLLQYTTNADSYIIRQVVKAVCPCVLLKWFSSMAPMEKQTSAESDHCIRFYTLSDIQSIQCTGVTLFSTAVRALFVAYCARQLHIS